MISALPRRRTLLAASTAAVLALLVSGCGTGGADAHRIRVGVSGDSPEWDVLAKEAKKEGLTVETVVLDDYSLPNKALSAGDIELNAFQHLVFLAQSNTENKADIAPIAATTVVPLGLYSSKHKQLADLPDRAEIALPNDPANQGRGLRVLEQAKLIELRKDAGLFATPDDITANPKHVKLTPVNAQQTPGPSRTRTQPSSTTASPSSPASRPTPRSSRTTPPARSPSPTSTSSRPARTRRTTPTTRRSSSSTRPRSYRTRSAAPATAPPTTSNCPPPSCRPRSPASRSS